ncbi:MAG: SCO family protein [Acidobacteria bacterium]|nr:SCO family protein [Acidobacteriota bacterium]
MAVHASDPLAEPAFVQWVEELERRQDTTALLELLREQHRIYEEQSSRRIVRMRGWILVLLSHGELPAAALPFVLEELDTSLDPYLVGAAALALRAYPQPRPEFAPFVLRALENIRGHDQPLSFARYGEYPRSVDASTAVRELLATAAWLGHHGTALAPRLRALGDAGTLPLRLRDDLDAALRAIDGTSREAKDEACCSFVLDLARFSWRSSERQDSKSIESTVFEDQSGVLSTYHDLFRGGPTIVAFFYTRCDNPLKCSLTIWKLAQVQRLLESRGVAGQIRTAAITYDPAFDLPDRLRTFGKNRGLRMDSKHSLLRAVDGIAPLRSYFGLGVSFAASLVNRHRIEVFLLDRQGRIAGSFQRLHWDEAHVVDEAVALLSDPPVAPSRGTVWSGLPAVGPSAAIIMACLPKCPLCWSAYLSSAGLTAFAFNAYPRALQLAGLLLLVHLGSVFWRARSTGQWFGFGLSLAGTALVGATIWSGPDAQPLGTVLVSAGALVSALGRRPSQWALRIRQVIQTGVFRRTVERT